MRAKDTHHKHIAVLSGQMDKYLARIDALVKENTSLKDEIKRLKEQIDSIEPLSNR